MYNKQFLFCSDKYAQNSLTESIGFNNYRLWYHKDLNVEYVEDDFFQVLLIGDIYDYRNPNNSNREILINSIINNEFNPLSLDHCCGAFNVIYRNKIKGESYLFSDSTGARECFYSFVNGEIILGATTILMNTIYSFNKDDNSLAKEFFNSSSFFDKLTYVGNKTEYKEILRLKPNKVLNINAQELVRFFPLSKKNILSLENGAQKSAEILKGFLKSINNRCNVAIPVSAGWDSRVLLAASKDISKDVFYYIFQLPEMDDKHQDIVIPDELLTRLKLKLNVLKSDKELSEERFDKIKQSISYPRRYNFRYLFNIAEKSLKFHVKLGGNVSEIARKEWDAVDLTRNTNKTAFLQKYPGSEYARLEYQRWLDNDKHFIEKAGYNVSDFIYWEENCPNWMGKGNTEIRMVSEIIHPFNSRELSETMLAVDSKYRDKHNPKLYKRITEILWPETLQVPVNPSFKKQVISFMQKIKVYGVYREILINLQLLKLKFRKGKH